MITSIVLATLLVAGGAGGVIGWHQPPPIITYYAPVPIWFPKYIGAPYSDYQVVKYVTPPEVTRLIVKQRILTINATNPALLPPPKPAEALPKPKALPPPQK